MEDKTSYKDVYKDLFKEFDNCLNILSQPSSVVKIENKDYILGRMQAILAAHSIRITGTSIASDSEEGTHLAITYEYKWVPTDGSKAIPRWDTGVMATEGFGSDDIYYAYVRIFRIVLEAREALREMPKQSMDL